MTPPNACEPQTGGFRFIRGEIRPRLGDDGDDGQGHDGSGGEKDSGDNQDGQQGKEEIDTGVAVDEGRPKLKEPPQYSVILHNDDYTTMEFVIEVLQRFFRKTGDEAIQVMLRVHHDGKGVAGIYSHDIAETKVVQVHERARTKGYPLKCSIEPAE